MATIEDIKESIRPIFEELINKGWKQNTNYKKEFVLENKHGVSAEQLLFPKEHVSFISKGGTIEYCGFDKLGHLEDALNSIPKVYR